MRAIRGWPRRSVAGRTPTTNWRSSIGSATRWRPTRRPGSVRPGAATSPSDLDRQIVDGAGRTGRCRWGIADRFAQLRPAGAAGGADGRRAGGAAARTRRLAAITLTPHGGWSFLLRGGAIEAAPVKGDAASITALVKRVRASIESPSGALPKFDTTAAQALYDATLAPVGARLAGAKALVVAPSGALLSLPFAAAADRPGPAQRPERRALADPPDDRRARAVGRQLRRAAQGGQLAGGARLVRLRRLPSCDAGAGRGHLPRRRLRRQRARAWPRCRHCRPLSASWMPPGNCLAPRHRTSCSTPRSPRKRCAA